MVCIIYFSQLNYQIIPAYLDLELGSISSHFVWLCSLPHMSLLRGGSTTRLPKQLEIEPNFDSDLSIT